jgi:hypothetical protein
MAKGGRTHCYGFERLCILRTVLTRLIEQSIDGARAHDIRVYGCVELDKLDEEALIRDSLNALRFVFLNILRDYLLLGRKRKGEDNELVRRILQVHMQDLVDITDVYGQVLRRRVQAGTIKLDRIKEIQANMWKDIEKQLLRPKTPN